MDLSPLLPWLLLAPWPEGLPPLTDLERFPPAAVVNLEYKRASDHLSWVAERHGESQGQYEWLQVNGGGSRYVEIRKPDPQAIQRAWYVRQEQARRTYEVWGALKAVTDSKEEGNEQVCREGLNNLRELLGRERYFCGELPPPIPAWRFWTYE